MHTLYDRSPHYSHVYHCMCPSARCAPFPHASHLCAHGLSNGIIHLFSRLLCKLGDVLNCSASSSSGFTTQHHLCLRATPFWHPPFCPHAVNDLPHQANQSLAAILKACEQLLIDFELSEPVFSCSSHPAFTRLK